jgi:hypothetical protein
MTSSQLLREELDTPEKRTKFMRGWMEDQNQFTTIYLFDVKHYGYDTRQHCEEELYQYDRQVCFYFFPHMKEREHDENEQERISKGSSIGGSGITVTG